MRIFFIIYQSTYFRDNFVASEQKGVIWALSGNPPDEGVNSKSGRTGRYLRVRPKKALYHTRIYLAQIQIVSTAYIYLYTHIINIYIYGSFLYFSVITCRRGSTGQPISSLIFPVKVHIKKVRKPQYQPPISNIEIATLCRISNNGKKWLFSRNSVRLVFDRFKWFKKEFFYFVKFQKKFVE